MPFVNSLVRLLMSLRDESGQGLAEYALITAIVSIVAVTLLAAIGVDVVDLIDDVRAGFVP